MKTLFLKINISLFFLLILVSSANAELFVVSVDEWINCEEQAKGITICQKNPTYKLIEKGIMPSINTNYYDDILNNVVKSKNEKIDKLENRVTGYVSYSSEVKDIYAAMEKVYLIGIALLSLVLINAYYQIYKLKKKK